MNPFAVAETVVNEGKNNNLFGSLNAELELVPALTAAWFGSWRKTDRMTGFFLPVKSTVAAAIDQEGFANISNNRQDEKLMNVSLGYKKHFQDHFVDVLALYEWQNQTYQGNYLQARGFFNDIATYNALQLGDLASVQPGVFLPIKTIVLLFLFLAASITPILTGTSLHLVTGEMVLQYLEKTINGGISQLWHSAGGSTKKAL